MRLNRKTGLGIWELQYKLAEQTLGTSLKLERQDKRKACDNIFLLFATLKIDIGSKYNQSTTMRMAKCNKNF